MSRKSANTSSYIQSFGRRSGRPLKVEKKQLLEGELPKWEIRLRESGYRNQEKAVRLSCEQGGEQGAFHKLHLEIGYGNGEHLVHRAQQQPNTLFIGCEVYEHGIAACLREIKDTGVTNIRLFIEDARLLLEQLPNACLERIYILFPDPWPKTRHHKRRIVNQETLDQVARLLQPCGQLHLATDHPDYAAWMLVQLVHRKDFHWLATCKQDWQTPPHDHNKTRYETKLKAGHEPVFFQFERGGK